MPRRGCEQKKHIAVLFAKFDCMRRFRNPIFRKQYRRHSSKIMRKILKHEIKIDIHDSSI